jgi:hypothetical protein
MRLGRHSKSSIKKKGGELMKKKGGELMGTLAHVVN